MAERIVIRLTDGREIRLALCPEYAPETVAHFVELVKRGYYTGLCFHRVINGFMIQGGGFRVDGNTVSDAPEARAIRGEFASNGCKTNILKHEAGVISMARTQDKNSATGQFFIMTDAAPHLDGDYAAFGKVEDPESLAVVRAIGKGATYRTARVRGMPYEYAQNPYRGNARMEQYYMSQLFSDFPYPDPVVIAEIVIAAD